MPKIQNKKRPDGRYKSKVHISGGKYKYVYAYSQRELDEKVTEVRLQLKKGIDIASERDSFEEWSEKWLKLKKVEVSNGRYSAYKGLVKKLERVKHIPISKIRTSDIQDIIIDMYNSKYAGKTMKDAKNTANQIFKLAVDNRIIDYNPATAVKIPAHSPEEKRRALTPEEQSWITAPTEHRAKRAAMIMMYAGLRRGELIPLLWTDMDLKAKTITINKSVEIINGKSIVKEQTKTKAGMRTIYIPQKLVDYLTSEDRENNMLVCPAASGNMMSGSAYKRLWDSYLTELNYKFGKFDNILVPDKLNPNLLVKYEKPDSIFNPHKVPFVIPRITAHWLRHTFITFMYMAGVDIITAKEQAGHADIKTTMEIYTHLDSIHKAKQIDKLDEYLQML